MQSPFLSEFGPGRQGVCGCRSWPVSSLSGAPSERPASRSERVNRVRAFVEQCPRVRFEAQWLEGCQAWSYLPGDSVIAKYLLLTKGGFHRFLTPPRMTGSADIRRTTFKSADAAAGRAACPTNYRCQRAPTTLKLGLSKTWCGQLTPM